MNTSSSWKDLYYEELRERMKFDTSWSASEELLPLDYIIIPGKNIKVKLYNYEMISKDGSMQNLWVTCEKLYQMKNAEFKQNSSKSFCYPYTFIEVFHKEKDGSYTVFMGS